MKKAVIFIVIFLVIILILGAVAGGIYASGKLDFILDPKAHPKGNVNQTLEVNSPPKAVINVNSTRVKANVNVTFDGNQSWDAEGNITKFTWNFGDGTPEVFGTDKGKVVHKFSDAGHFLVNLTVRDENGASNRTSLQMFVSRSDTHEPIGSILMSRDNPLFPSNKSFTFEVEKDALSVNITLSFVGGNFQLDLRITSPTDTLLHNETVSSLFSDSADVLLTASQVSRVGTYNMILTCGSGSAYVSGSIDVNY